MNIPNIHLVNAGVSYANKPVFSNLTLTIQAGSWTAIIGPSGVGKSTLLRMLAGLTDKCEQFSGEILADNHLPLPNQVAYMAQTDSLLPWLTVLDNVLLGSKLLTQSKQQRKLQREQAINLLQKVGLATAKFLYPHQLSGGMRQRAALVRTLLENKPIILMDEPFAALDMVTRYNLQELAAKLLQYKTVIFITHEPSEALRLAQYIYLMHDQPAQLKLVTLTNETQLFAELLRVSNTT